jgi:hypothetical protein
VIIKLASSFHISSKVPKNLTELQPTFKLKQNFTFSWLNVAENGNKLVWIPVSIA